MASRARPTCVPAQSDQRAFVVPSSRSIGRNHLRLGNQVFKSSASEQIPEASTQSWDHLGRRSDTMSLRISPPPHPVAFEHVPELDEERVAILGVRAGARLRKRLEALGSKARLRASSGPVVDAQLTHFGNETRPYILWPGRTRPRNGDPFDPGRQPVRPPLIASGSPAHRSSPIRCPSAGARFSLPTDAVRPPARVRFRPFRFLTPPTATASQNRASVMPSCR